MINRKSLIALVALCFFVPRNGHAYSGHDLFADCNKVNQMESAFCLGFIFGFFEASAMNGGRVLRDNTSERMYCMPAQTPSLGQIRDAVIQMMGRHPQVRNGPAAFSVAISLELAFPCGARR
jgi:hypothetical protein